MNDFDFDAMQKKRIARGAAHMKRGSKSTKCSLPSDHMTQAQWKRRNGPVSTYRLDAPMKFETFTEMPSDLKKKYLESLYDLYGASDRRIGDMMGVSQHTSARHRNNLGIVRTGARIGAEELARREAMWSAFCNGVVGGAPEKREAEPFPVPSVTEPIKVEEPVIEMLPEEPEIPVEMSEKPEALLEMANKKLDVNTLIDQMFNCPKFEAKEAPKFDLDELSAVFSGEFSPERFLRFVTQLPMPEGNVRIKVEVTKA